MSRRLRLALVLPLLVGLAAPSFAEAGKNRRPTRVRIATATATAPKASHERGKAARAVVTRKAPIALPRIVVGYRADPRTRLPVGPAERLIFGVMGGAGKTTPRWLARAMRSVGSEIARGGHVTLTGACVGLPDEAAIGAKADGGLTMGISSYSTIEAHLAAGQPTNFDVLQLTRLPPSQAGQDRPNYMGREIDNVERSDVILVAGGRFGTLGELAIALEEKRPIGVLLGSGGISDIVEQIVAASTKAGKPPGAPIVYDRDPRRLVRKLIAAKRAFDAAGGTTGPLGDGV